MAVQKRKINTTDRRVKRTKQALRDAFFKLLEDKTINEITVTELTNLADVNRATFYFYYTDLIDMLEQIQNDAYESFEKVVESASVDTSTIEGLTTYAERVIEHCKEQEKLTRFIINNDINNQLYKRIQQLMLKNVPNTKDVYPISNPARYTSNYVLTAMTSVLIDWMDEGMPVSSRDLAEFFANIAINGMIRTKQLFLTHKSNID